MRLRVVLFFLVAVDFFAADDLRPLLAARVVFLAVLLRLLPAADDVRADLVDAFLVVALRAELLLRPLVALLFLVPDAVAVDLRRLPELEAALRAADLRRGAAPDFLVADEVDERFDEAPVREPAPRLELLRDDFLVAMLLLRNGLDQLT